MGTGGMDGSAAFKAFVVTLVALLFLAQYCALLRYCGADSVEGTIEQAWDGGWNSLNDCKVPVFDISMGIAHKGDLKNNGTWAMYYAVCYAAMACISFIGCGMIMCKSDGFAKFYALCLMVLFVIISIGDYWMIIAILGFDSPKPDVDIRNYAGFRIAVTWFLQLGLFVNAAYDAWDTDDERKIDVGDMVGR